MQAELKLPFRLGSRELYVTASIGIALSSPAIAAAGELVRNADIAMYDAKRGGRGHVEVFDQSMHRRVVTRLARENELRFAIEGGLMQVHFQPIVELATRPHHQLRGAGPLAGRAGPRSAPPSSSRSPRRPA